MDIHTGHLSIEVLQSQLFILKVLSMAMASRWAQHEQAPGSRGTDADSISFPPPSVRSAQAHGHTQTHSEHSSAASWQEPPPLDDSCVKYILSVMVLFMRQTFTPDAPLMLHTRSTDISFRDYEEHSAFWGSSAPDTIPVGDAAAFAAAEPKDRPLRNRHSVASVRSGRLNIRVGIHLPAANMAYETTHGSFVRSPLAVNALIAKHVGRIVFHISASNWAIVHERLAAKITHLAAHTADAGGADLVDLNLMSHCVMDRQRLVTLLNRKCVLFFVYAY